MCPALSGDGGLRFRPLAYYCGFSSGWERKKKRGLLAQRVCSHPPTPGAPRRTDYLAEGPRWTRAIESWTDALPIFVIQRLGEGGREGHPCGPVLPERARSECARSTGAVGPTGAPFQERSKRALKDYVEGWWSFEVRRWRPGQATACITRSTGAGSWFCWLAVINAHRPPTSTGFKAAGNVRCRVNDPQDAYVQLRVPHSCLVEVHHMCYTSFRT